MKIRLLNFRCYEDQTFDFGDEGLILLSASSGAGKSTILMAIHFALFGIGSKVTSAGKTSCKVEFEFGELKVVRTKRPNRLLVNDIYEDDEGQKIINEKFGEVFDVTGYISQNALNSFILKSPSDKLEFLEQFAFKDIDLMRIKGVDYKSYNEANINFDVIIYSKVINVFSVIIGSGGNFMWAR